MDGQVNLKGPLNGKHSGGWITSKQMAMCWSKRSNMIHVPSYDHLFLVVYAHPDLVWLNGACCA